MRQALWVLLALAPQYVRAAVPTSSPQEPVPNVSTPMNEEDVHRANSTKNIPGIRACGYYADNAKVVDIMRLEMHSKTCRSDANVDSKLPDRPEMDEYQVDGVFDTPNRF